MNVARVQRHTAARGTMADALADALRVVLSADAKIFKRIDAAPSTSSARTHRDVVESLATLRARARNVQTIDSALDPILARIAGSKSAKGALVCMCQADASSARAIGDALSARVKASDDATRALNSCVGIDAIASADVDVRAVFDVRDTLRALCDATRAHGSGKPTRLGTAACEAFTSLGGRAALSSNDSDGGFDLLECVPAFTRVIAVVESWAPESSGCGIFRESCERARECLEATTASTSRRNLPANGDVDEGERNGMILAKSRLVTQIWSDWAPALMPIKSKKDETKLLSALKGAFSAASDMVNSDDENAATGVAHALITIGLNLGRLGIDHSNREVFASMVSEETARALDEMLQENVAVVLLPALRCSNVVAQSVAAVLIRVVLAPEHLGWTEQSESLLNGVLPLVEEDDKVISTGFARLVADLTARNPREDALINILQLCGGSARSAKISALNVLSEVLRLGREMTDDTIAAVTTTTLPRLKDKDIESRKAATAVLAHIPPQTMLPTLIRLLVSKDAEERAAAGDAFVSMLSEQRSPAQAMQTYFSALASMSRTEDAGADAERAKTTADAIGRATKLLTRFAETVSSDDWPNIAQVITRAVFDAPAASAFHQSMIALMPWIGVIPARTRVFDSCIAAFNSQSDDKSSGSGDEDEDAIDIFNRLAPVLVLRALPLDAFDDVSSVKDVHTHVLRRMLNIQDEYEDVRRVASEVFGRMPSDIIERELFPALRDAYAGAKVSRDDLARVRTCMFSCNCALASRGVDAFSDARRDELRTFAADALTWPAASADDMDVTKLHMGAMETLASLIVAESQSPTDSDDNNMSTKMPQTSSALLEPQSPAASLRLNDAPMATSGRALIVEISDDEIKNLAIKTSKAASSSQSSRPTLRGVLSLACGALEDNDAPAWINAVERRRDVPLRLAMMNVIIATSRRPKSAHTHALVNACVPQLVTCAEHRGEPEIRAAALQALMMVFHTAASADAVEHAVPLVQTITSILRDHACGDVVRMGATRVATALLAGDEPVLRAIEPHLGALRAALDVAARVAADQEVSSLAAKLASCMTA